MMSGSLIKVMQKRMMLCCFLLLVSVGGVNSERTDAFRGQAFTLFSNTDVDNNDKKVSLYRNVNRSILIATWRWKDCPIEVVHMNPDYKGRIDMDISKNIWIWKMDVNDTGKFCIKCSKTEQGIEVDLNVLEKKLTEEEIKNWLDDHSGFIEKYLGNLTDEVGKEISKWLEDHPGLFEKLFDSSDLKLFLIIITSVIVPLLLLVEPLSKCLAEVCTVIKSSMWRIYSSVIDQDQKWHHHHSDSEEINYGKLTEDQISEQIQKWQDVYPGLFKKKYLELLTEDQVHQWVNDHPNFFENYRDQNDGICSSKSRTFTLEEFGITRKEVDNETEDNQSPLKLSEMLKEDQVQKWVKDQSDCLEKFVDEPENYHKAFLPAIVDLGIKRTERMTEREDNQKQWMSSQKKVISIETCSSSSSEIEVGMLLTAHQRQKKRVTSVNKIERVTEV